MKLPMQVYKLAKGGDKVAQAFVQQYGKQEGQYQEGMWEQFKNSQNADKLQQLQSNTDFEEDLTPEEKKATEVIEGYGDKYGSSKEDVDWWERDDYADKYPYADEDKSDVFDDSMSAESQDMRVMGDKYISLIQEGKTDEAQELMKKMANYGEEENFEYAESHSEDNIKNYLEWNGIFGYDDDIEEIMSPDTGGTFEERKENLREFLEEEGIFGYDDKIADFYKENTEDNNYEDDLDDDSFQPGGSVIPAKTIPEHQTYNPTIDLPSFKNKMNSYLSGNINERKTNKIVAALNEVEDDYDADINNQNIKDKQAVKNYYKKYLDSIRELMKQKVGEAGSRLPSSIQKAWGDLEDKLGK